MKKVVFLLICLLLISTREVQASLITQPVSWAETGVNVYLTYPDKVTAGDYFDISFFIDGAEIDPSLGMIAFLPNLWVSNTVDISEVTWSETIYSPLDTTWGGDFNGTLGDANSLYTADSSGYTINLTDPYFQNWGSNYTWLDKSYGDQVTWSLHNFIIQGDTNFTVTLDAGIWGGGLGYGNFTVVDPPLILNNEIPEPASCYLLALGLIILKDSRRFF